MEILENINFSENASLSDSEFTFTRSELESSKEEYSIQKMQTGGGLFCNDELTDILLGCLSDSRPDIACYLFCKLQKFPKKLSKTDESGRNILHFMTIFASHGNMVLHIAKLAKTISKSEFSNALNKQDINGNTCLHYSAKLGFNNLTKLYIEYGADCSIRNNDGYFVEEDKLESEKKPVDVSVIVVTDTPNKVNYDMFQNLNQSNLNKSTDSETMIQMTRTDKSDRNGDRFSSTSHLDSVNFFKEVEAQLDKANEKLTNKVETNTEIGKLESVSTQQIIDDILANVRGVNSDVNSDNENNISVTSEMSVNTANIIDDILRKNNEQKGGAKKKKSNKKGSNKKGSDKKKSKSKISRISGERKLTMYSEISVSPIASDDEDVSAIARQISRQSSDVHERVVQKIMKLLKLDENNADDVNKARNYKAAIYKMVKEKNPLLNNFDRAVEMEKTVTLELLKSIDIEKVTKEIQKHLSEKSASEKSTVKSDKTVTATSSATSTATETEKKKSKSTQKRIPEFNPNSSESSTFQIMQESSISFSTVSEF